MNQILNIEETYNTREVEEIVEEFKEIYGDYLTGYFCCNGSECGCNGTEVDIEAYRWLRTTLHHQLQKAREEEREKARDLYQGLQMMFDQYCPNGDHQYMMAGETAEELLDMYTDLQCDCEKAPEQQEWDGHTRYCKALTHSELDQDKK